MLGNRLYNKKSKSLLQVSYCLISGVSDHRWIFDFKAKQKKTRKIIITLMFFIMCNRHTNSVAHSCYGNTKFKATKSNYLLQKPNNHGINKTNHDNLKVTTAMANRSRQKQIHHGKNKFITAKSNLPRQNQIHHGKIKFTTAKSNSSRQIQIHHDKIKFITAKTK